MLNVNRLKKKIYNKLYKKNGTKHIFNQCSIYKTTGGETRNWGLAFWLFFTNKKVCFCTMTSQT